VDRRNFLQRLLSASAVATKATPRRETEAELRARIAELEKQVAPAPLKWAFVVRSRCFSTTG
jgi:hypothetical protein